MSKDFKDYFKIDYIGRYVPMGNGKFEFKISERAKISPLLTRLAGVLQEARSLSEVRHRTKDYFEMQKVPFSLGKIGDVKWDAPNNRCVVKITNDNLCAIIPMELIEEELCT